MTAIHFVQLACERPKCPTRYPYEPSVRAAAADETSRPFSLAPMKVDSIKALRTLAASAGWEVMRGKHGRDVCPGCRVNEIRSLSGMAEVGESRER